MHSEGQGSSCSLSPFAGEKADARDSSLPALRAAIPPRELRFLQQAQGRMVGAMIVLGVLGAIALWIAKGWSWGAGFAAGAAVAVLNFLWLKSAANMVADAFDTTASLTTSRRRRPWIMVRFILRYALLGVSAYAIFLSSAVSLRAFLMGLFVLAGGLMIEAVFQVVNEFRRGAGKD